jgi:predicted membrane protein
MRNLFWGFILVMFGILLLLDNMGIADFGEMIHDYWPLILILWGISILTRRGRRHRNYQEQPPPQYQPPSPAPDQGYQAPPPPPPPPSAGGDFSFTMESDVIHQSEVFGDTHISAHSQNFMGGSVSTVFGDCNVDLSKIKIAEGEHTLRVHTVFGDSRIILPPNSAVSISANSTFGDMYVKDQQKGGFSSYIYLNSQGYESATNKLKIVISKVFGDLIVT